MCENSHNGTINAMSTIFLTGAKASKRVSFILRPLYLSSCTVRYASINSGINRGLRKSKGVGFRGKDKGRPSREDGGAGRGFQVPRSDPHWKNSGSVDDLGSKNKSMHTRFKGNDRDDESKPKYKTSSRFGDRQDRGNDWEGKSENFKPLRAKGSYGEESFDTYREPRSSKPGYEKKSYGSYGSGEEIAGYQKRSTGRSHEFPEKRRADEKDSFNKSFGSSRDILKHKQKSYPNFGEVRMISEKGYEGPRNWAKGFTYPSKYPTREERLAVKSMRSGSSSEYSRSSPQSEPGSESHPSEFSPPKTSSSFAKNIPISIPYTTPASEFLYGTSVVEAALNTRRRKSRKLYKLYIHKGEDRHSGDRDGFLARLAQRKGVEVAIVRGHDWLRTLDKMSQGRPHNGYILEASPLPRLPVISLGSVIDQGDSFAIQLAPDRQSREELEVHGNDTTINVPKDSSGRKPLVLLLDSIEDPQNLGAILRTALFMGVTAVAISVRNSASFTPVVFKASAGAAETIEIFSVNKPGGFIKDSQASGWKIYAAVAPPATRKPDSRYMWPATSQEFVWSHKLQDPLREDPCILMVGGEGEGLRKNLRDHADVHISIKGAAMRGKLDSLNVSVATGMLCGAFMRQTARKTVEEAVKEVEVEIENLNENQVF
ncbi:8141f1c8-6b75-4445-9046-84d89a655f09-CDS [Sclerotinia trifoliorum]|uniref:rRNA methyltransferase 1, mitochondrial n=1 Tax=Sclerotinia trifoliorum TaxID=28548 RepID=A0A8H2W2Y9_9HELO|nr:8141f1c8-6b75-4445-9046-84d89a655f09-CDS [Sclerotinia trifoliorum]